MSWLIKMVADVSLLFWILGCGGLPGIGLWKSLAHNIWWNHANFLLYCLFYNVGENLPIIVTSSDLWLRNKSYSTQNCHILIIQARQTDRQTDRQTNMKNSKTHCPQCLVPDVRTGQNCTNIQENIKISVHSPSRDNSMVSSIHQLF